MCAISGQDNYVSTVREYEGPFGEWHNERLCAPKGFMKEGQQNYQSYQGIFTGKHNRKSLVTHNNPWLYDLQMMREHAGWVLYVTMGRIWMQLEIRIGCQIMSGLVLLFAPMIRSFVDLRPREALLSPTMWKSIAWDFIAAILLNWMNKGNILYWIMTNILWQDDGDKDS